MSTLEIVELIIIGIIALFLLVYYGIKAIKNKWVEELTITVNNSIKYAEEHYYEGFEKKKYVLQEVEAKCQELGIPYALIQKLISKLVDKIVANYNVIKKG